MINLRTFKPRSRLLTSEDFDRCWAISTISGSFSPQERDQLRAAWRYLLPRDEMRGVVVEDINGGSAGDVLAFGASVFVSDDWMMAFRSRCEPLYLTRSLLKAGRSDSGILNSKQIGLYNAQGGLNLVCTHRGEFFCGSHLGEFAAAQPKSAAMLIKCLVDGFQAVHRGFQLREILNEAHGCFEKSWSLEGGNWTVRDDFSEYYLGAPECFPTDKNHRYLIGATAYEPAINSALWCMFQFTPPSLMFSARQKQILLQAIEGRSNRAISKRLQIGEEAVRSAFRAGYEKIEHFTNTFGDVDERTKRQRLLELVRTQMEEIRPWSPKPIIARLNQPIFAVSAPLCCVKPSGCT